MVQSQHRRELRYTARMKSAVCVLFYFVLPVVVTLFMWWGMCLRVNHGFFSLMFIGCLTLYIPLSWSAPFSDKK